MTQDTTTETEEPPREDIREIVREELAAHNDRLFEQVPITRRDLIVGLSTLGVTAATTLSATEIGLVGKASAQSGSGTLGSSSEPLAAIYVADLIQSPTSVGADELYIAGNRLTIGSTPSSPSAGDVRITEDTS